MLPTYRTLRFMIKAVLAHKEQQGHVVAGLAQTLEKLPDSYDALIAFARSLSNLPLRADWKYVEPNELAEIWEQCDPRRPTGAIANVDPADAARRVEAGFLASCCGCILGKPLEFNPSLDQIRAAAQAVGEWPLRDYVTARLLDTIGKRHDSWASCCRDQIQFVAPDDDINYTILGMLALEQNGVGLTREHVRDLWLHHLPIDTTFGPERTCLLKAGNHYLRGDDRGDVNEYAVWLNPGDEYCGAVIRADAYGYACPGNPALAADLAWRDASWTHRRTGVYGTMYVAAAIAAAQAVRDPFEVFRIAQQFVPQRSRFYEIVSDSLEQVRQGSDWLDGYNRIHQRYGEYTHCKVYQEIGTLINTLRFAADVGDGIGKQVAQGNDTDSFGATCGSILGCFFGPGYLEDRWLAPFNDEIHTALAWFPDHSLSQLAKRMSKLPARIAKDLAERPASGTQATTTAEPATKTPTAKTPPTPADKKSGAADGLAGI